MLILKHLNGRTLTDMWAAQRQERILKAAQRILDENPDAQITNIWVTLRYQGKEGASFSLAFKFAEVNKRKPTLYFVEKQSLKLPGEAGVTELLSKIAELVKADVDFTITVGNVDDCDIARMLRDIDFDWS